MIEDKKIVNLKIGRSIFNPVYYDFKLHHKPIEIYYGGGGSGKSNFIATRAVIDVLNGHNYLCIRNTAVSLRTSVFMEILKAIDRLKVNELFNIRESDMTITCLNKKQFIFKGLDDVEKIKSVTPRKGVITDIWVEEATETRRADIAQLQVRLRGQSKIKKRIIMTFNPISKNHWIYKDYFKHWKESENYYEDDRVSILKTTYKDNQFLTEEDIERLENLKYVDDIFYNVYALGNWGTLGQMIFNNWEIEDLSNMKNEFTNIRCGVDFGFSIDPDAFIKCHVGNRVVEIDGKPVKQKVIYIFDEFYLKGLSSNELAEMIKSKISPKQKVTCESADPRLVSALKSEGINASRARKGPGSVLAGIKYLMNYKIVIDENCVNAIDEFQNYKWKEDAKGQVQEIPEDKNNHLIDALRYALEDDMKPKIETIDYARYSFMG